MSLGQSVCGSLRDQGEQEASLSFGVVGLSTDVRSICAQGSHQIVYALSVFVGPSFFWLHRDVRCRKGVSP